jgi:hypothetical protein
MTAKQVILEHGQICNVELSGMDVGNTGYVMVKKEKKKKKKKKMKS